MNRRSFSILCTMLSVGALAGCRSHHDESSQAAGTNSAAQTAAPAKEISLLNASYDPTRELYVDFNKAFDARVRNQVVHAVERSQKRAFAAAGRADECRDDVGRHFDRHVGQRLFCAVIEVEVFDPDLQGTPTLRATRYAPVSAL